MQNMTYDYLRPGWSLVSIHWKLKDQKKARQDCDKTKTNYSESLVPPCMTTWSIFLLRLMFHLTTLKFTSFVDEVHLLAMFLIASLNASS